MTKNNQIKTKKTFLALIKTYPVRFLLIIMLIILPIVFVATLYLVMYFSHNTFTFSEDGNDPNFTYSSVEDLPINLRIHYTRTEAPTEIIPGSLIFYTGYTRKDIPITSVTAFFILHTHWQDTTSRTRVNLNTYNDANPRETKITYNHHLPLTPLWFIHIVSPNLYIKLEILSNGVTSTYFLDLGPAIR